MTDPRFDFTVFPPITILMSRDPKTQEYFYEHIRSTKTRDAFEDIVSPLTSMVEAFASALPLDALDFNEPKLDAKVPFENTTALETTPTWRDMASRLENFFINNFGSDAILRYLYTNGLDEIVQIGGRALVWGLSGHDAKRVVERYGVNKCCVLYLDGGVPNPEWGTPGLRFVHCGGKHNPADQLAHALSELR